jgi:DNA-binding FadR family transcriptional regulator
MQLESATPAVAFTSAVTNHPPADRGPVKPQVKAVEDERKPLSDMEVIRKILTFISGRGFEPGERLPSERDLALRFGVSRNVVREAIQSLVTVRVIEARPTSGNYLRRLDAESSFEALVLLNAAGIPLSPEDIAQSLEVRLLLEREAIRLACQRRTDENLAEMKEIIERTDEAIQEGRSIEDEDQEFHLALIKASGNRILVRVMNAFYELSRSRRRIFFSTPANRQASSAAHRAILAAITKRDVDKGIKLIRSQLENARRYFAAGSGVELDEKPVTPGRSVRKKTSPKRKPAGA